MVSSLLTLPTLFPVSVRARTPFTFAVLTGFVTIGMFNVLEARWPSNPPRELLLTTRTYPTGRGNTLPRRVAVLVHPVVSDRSI